MACKIPSHSTSVSAEESDAATSCYRLSRSSPSRCTARSGCIEFTVRPGPNTTNGISDVRLSTDGIVVTNARLIIACLSAACCAVCLADCVDQIQIHYGRASYRHAYLIHELKWPILYLIAW